MYLNNQVCLPMPVYEIANARERSAASQSGLQVGDIIVSINNKEANRYSLQEMNF
jgi:type II secretory pathway component PulC